MFSDGDELYWSARDWAIRSDFVSSAVLFGSTARRMHDSEKAGLACSDWDIHLISPNPRRMSKVDWAKEMPEVEFCMAAVRPASGGVRKWTVVFSSGQLDIVVVPAVMMLVANVGYRCGLHRRSKGLRAALNEMATCLRGGYQFIKGERRWGEFYRDVSHLPGVRLNDSDVVALADSAICDVLWVLQKLSLGEVIAAQNVLHCRVVATNLRLWRELRIRKALPLPSFGLGRKVEEIGEAPHLTALSVSALARIEDLESATRTALSGLQMLTAEMIPDWKISPRMQQLLRRHGPSSRHP